MDWMAYPLLGCGSEADRTPPPCKAFIGLVGRLLRPPPGYRQDGQRAGADAPSKAFIGPKNELGGYKLARFFFQ